MPELRIRQATPDDSPVILTLLRELADFENLLADFATDEATIKRDFFSPHAAVQCEIALEGGQAVGLATWFWTYRSFKAARGLFIEDLYVRPAWRGKGYGTALLRHLAARAVRLGATRLEWLVLDWNKASMDFYRSLGARPVEDWLGFRLEGEALRSLGQ